VKRCGCAPAFISAEALARFVGQRFVFRYRWPIAWPDRSRSASHIAVVCVFVSFRGVSWFLFSAPAHPVSDQLGLAAAAYRLSGIDEKILGRIQSIGAFSLGRFVARFFIILKSSRRWVRSSWFIVHPTKTEWRARFLFSCRRVEASFFRATFFPLRAWPSVVCPI